MMLSEKIPTINEPVCAYIVRIRVASVRNHEYRCYGTHLTFSGPGRLQVVDKGSDAVLDEVESVLFRVALSILNGEGFSYDVPSRSKGVARFLFFG